MQLPEPLLWLSVGARSETMLHVLVHSFSLCADSCRQIRVCVQTIINRNFIPNIVNTQMLFPFQNVDPQVKVAFPGVDVNDRDRANVRPPHPSLCVGNGFVIEATDMVRHSSSHSDIQFKATA